MCYRAVIIDDVATPLGSMAEICFVVIVERERKVGLALIGPSAVRLVFALDLVPLQCVLGGPRVMSHNDQAHIAPSAPAHIHLGYNVPATSPVQELLQGATHSQGALPCFPLFHHITCTT